MGQTIAEKIIGKRCDQPDVKAGDMVIASVDCAMVDDILGPRMFAEQMKQLGAAIWDKNRVVVVTDHYTPPGTIAQADIVKFTREWVMEHGLKNYFEGMGPCHQMLAENGFDIPATIQVGTDSHTCMAGAFGCLGTGVGSSEMISILATGEIWLRVPESMRINWTGKLSRYVMAKDIILHTIGVVGHSGATYMSMEFSGSAITAISMDERMCIANMAVEAGAKCGLIASDEETKRYLIDIGQGDKFVHIDADDDAIYAAGYEFDASQLTPQIACPHEVDNVVPIGEMESTPVQHAYIGSCTGGRLNDIEIASQILKGKKIDKKCRLFVCPASKKIWSQAAKMGLLEILFDAGATILAPTCGACMGVHSGLVSGGENSVSSTNRNFKGRMGSPEGSIYLASPATVAASALCGQLCDPREVI